MLLLRCRCGCLVLRLLLLWATGPAGAEAETAEQLSPYFGTKSRYEELHPHLLQDPLSLGPPQPGFPLPPASCVPLQLSAVVRHGTRFPTRKQIEKLGRLHSLVLQRNGSGSCPAAERLARWEMWLRPDMDGKLATRGRRDMEMLARRLASRFPSLLAPKRRFAFVSSSKHRCLDSSAAFRDGLRQALYGQQPTAKRNDTVRETFEINDKLMRFFDHCEKFVRDVEDNNTAMHEVDAFKESVEMKKVVEKIAESLGLPVNDLNADLVQVAFFTCSFELAIHNSNSPWCSLFTKENAKVLEYLNDLKQYWKRAYGYDINSRSSCILFQDIFNHLDQAALESKSSKPVSSPVILQFGHAETLQPLLALMGYFKDEEPLKAHNYHRHQHRKFRSGRIVPYASNLLFVLYHCDQARSPEEEYKIQILLNEKLLQFPHSGETVSLYTSLKNHYKNYLQSCHFSEVCTLPTNATRVN
ncbi:Multiple inositol polyphosphate phosphatase 1 [Varanus komodoensis]|uniref:Multiple inositol polyphosphate phosphatase 1 n=1 Tax=Varanus komodoensis TaxID=61221 RepID=A0A8D2IVP6_VARKO|nr:multiple inositol polyphosphate phosphatase 1 [Varanus komodoensis]KAF7247263.1 Multiple inositol polyphosphate phosphatase 1 [Varanus komodoensis]